MKKKITTLVAILIAATGQAQWSLTGNAGTNPAVNFIGTTDAQPLIFKTNNFFSGILDPNRQNTAFGMQSLMSNTTGTFNVALGQQAMWVNTTGGSNVAIGGGALHENTTGVGNTAVGNGALWNNTITQHSTAVGVSSLIFSTGTGNTAIGGNTFLNCYNGIANTALGYAADFNAQLPYNNTTAIGYAAVVSASNQVRVGNSNVTSIGGVVSWTTVSDGRFKSHIQSNVPGLAFINQLKPVTYTLNVSELSKFLRPNGITDKDGKKLNLPELTTDATTSEKIIHTGFIAQDVEAVAKKLGFDFNGIDKPKTEQDIYGLRYAEFVTPLVQAVQELSNANDNLKAEINNLKSQLSDIMQQIKELKNGQGASISGVNPVLKQNSPKPFNSNTIIGYFIPTTSKNAQMIVTNSKGQLLKTIPLKSYGESQITINAGELAAGSYFYTLTVDGQRMDTKQMILTK